MPVARSDLFVVFEANSATDIDGGALGLVGDTGERILSDDIVATRTTRATLTHCLFVGNSAYVGDARLLVGFPPVQCECDVSHETQTCVHAGTHGAARSR